MIPQESEALGFLEVDYNGFTVRTSLPDQWPLYLIRQGRMIDAVEGILGDQFDEYLDRFPSFKDVAPFTDLLAEAAGIPGDGPFGGIPLLLMQLEMFPDDAESWLSSTHHVSLVDYYRGTLTLREVFVRLKKPWNRTDFLLADVFHAVARQPHPERPLSEMDKARVAAQEEERKRQEALLKAKEAQYNPAQAAADKARANALKEQRRGHRG